MSENLQICPPPILKLWAVFLTLYAMIINNRNEIKLYALLHLPDTAGEMQLCYDDFRGFMQRNRAISANVIAINPTISTTIAEVANYMDKIRDYCSEVFVNFSIADDCKLTDEEFFSLLSKILELAYVCDVQYGVTGVPAGKESEVFICVAAKGGCFKS